MSEQLKINRLVITGPSREYDVAFHDGVNLIVGPMMTGKSSILKLIDYCLGAKLKPEFPEIKKCSFVSAEVVAGGEVLTVRRSLRSESAGVEMFEGSFADAMSGSVKPTVVASRQSLEHVSLSSEVMRRLGWQDVKVKAAPTQDSSSSSTFSLRDLVALMYVDQTRVSDERSAFFERHPYKNIKWKAGVELVYGLHDDVATSLSSALAATGNEEQSLRRYLTSAQRFLDDSQIALADELRTSLAMMEQQRNELLARQSKLRDASEVELGDSLALVRARDRLRREIREKGAQLDELERVLAQLGRLRVQYEREKAQLEFLEESERLIGALPVVTCPVCAQGVEFREGSDCYLCTRPLPPKEKAISVERRLRATKRRIGDLEEYSAQLVASREGIAAQVARDEQEVMRMTTTLSRVEQSSMLPSARAVAEVGALLSDLDRKMSTAREQLWLRERAEGAGTNLLAVQERLRRLQAQVQEASRSRISPEEVVSTLGAELQKVLEEVRFPFLSGVGIDSNTLHPFVRGAPYRDLSSKGAVSLVVTAWHLATLRYALKRSTMFPMLLMLDSPLNHVGRDSADPDFADQRIVEAFYDLLRELHTTDAERFQIILVDNHPPSAVRDLVAAEFVGKGGEGRSGLISDE